MESRNKVDFLEKAESNLKLSGSEASDFFQNTLNEPQIGSPLQTSHDKKEFNPPENETKFSSQNFRYKLNKQQKRLFDKEKDLSSNDTTKFFDEKSDGSRLKDSADDFNRLINTLKSIEKLEKTSDFQKIAKGMRTEEEKMEEKKKLEKIKEKKFLFFSIINRFDNKWKKNEEKIKEFYGNSELSGEESYKKCNYKIEKPDFLVNQNDQNFIKLKEKYGDQRYMNYNKFEENCNKEKEEFRKENSRLVKIIEEPKEDENTNTKRTIQDDIQNMQSEEDSKEDKVEIKEEEVKKPEKKTEKKPEKKVEKKQSKKEEKKTSSEKENKEPEKEILTKEIILNKDDTINKDYYLPYNSSNKETINVDNFAMSNGPLKAEDLASESKLMSTEQKNTFTKSKQDYKFPPEESIKTDMNANYFNANETIKFTSNYFQSNTNNSNINSATFGKKNIDYKGNDYRIIKKLDESENDRKLEKKSHCSSSVGKKIYVPESNELKRQYDREEMQKLIDKYDSRKFDKEEAYFRYDFNTQYKENFDNAPEYNKNYRPSSGYKQNINQYFENEYRLIEKENNYFTEKYDNLDKKYDEQIEREKKLTTKFLEEKTKNTKQVENKMEKIKNNFDNFYKNYSNDEARKTPLKKKSHILLKLFDITSRKCLIEKKCLFRWFKHYKQIIKELKEKEVKEIKEEMVKKYSLKVQENNPEKIIEKIEPEKVPQKLVQNIEKTYTYNKEDSIDPAFSKISTIRKENYSIIKPETEQSIKPETNQSIICKEGKDEVLVIIQPQEQMNLHPIKLKEELKHSSSMGRYKYSMKYENEMTERALKLKKLEEEINAKKEEQKLLQERMRKIEEEIFKNNKKSKLKITSTAYQYENYNERKETKKSNIDNETDIYNYKIYNNSQNFSITNNNEKQISCIKPERGIDFKIIQNDQTPSKTSNKITYTTSTANNFYLESTKPKKPSKEANYSCNCKCKECCPEYFENFEKFKKNTEKKKKEEYSLALKSLNRYRYESKDPSFSVKTIIDYKENEEFLSKPLLQDLKQARINIDNKIKREINEKKNSNYPTEDELPSEFNNYKDLNYKYDERVYSKKNGTAHSVDFKKLQKSGSINNLVYERKDKDEFEGDLNEIIRNQYYKNPDFVELPRQHSKSRSTNSFLIKQNGKKTTRKSTTPSTQRIRYCINNNLKPDEEFKTYIPRLIDTIKDRATQPISKRKERCKTPYYSKPTKKSGYSTDFRRKDKNLNLAYSNNNPPKECQGCYCENIPKENRENINYVNYNYFTRPEPNCQQIFKLPEKYIDPPARLNKYKCQCDVMYGDKYNNILDTQNRRKSEVKYVNVYNPENNYELSSNSNTITNSQKKNNIFYYEEKYPPENLPEDELSEGDLHLSTLNSNVDLCDSCKEKYKRTRTPVDYKTKNNILEAFN